VVKTAKDVNTNALPNRMYEAGNEINPEQQPEIFAEFFDNKIKDILAHTSLEKTSSTEIKRCPQSKNFVCRPN
jgi:hypothetical protein